MKIKQTMTVISMVAVLAIFAGLPATASAQGAPAGGGIPTQPGSPIGGGVTSPQPGGAAGGGVTAQPQTGSSSCGGVQTSIISCSQTNNKSQGVQGNAVWGVLVIAMQVLTGLVGIAAVGGIVYGAILYTTAQDDAGQVKKAIEIIRNVVIGIIAYGLMYLGLNFLVPGGVFV